VQGYCRIVHNQQARLIVVPDKEADQYVQTKNGQEDHLDGAGSLNAQVPANHCSVLTAQLGHYCDFQYGQ
jgi:hypothetical protein